MTTFYLILLTVLFWGIAPIFDKAAVNKGDPFIGVILRGITIGIAMVMAALLSGKVKDIFVMPKQSAVYFALSGLIAGAFGVFTYFKALQLAPTSKIVPLAATYPLVTALFSTLFLGESISIERIIGIILIIVGIWLVQ